jgi:hypothetical protein
MAMFKRINDNKGIETLLIIVLVLLLLLFLFVII